METDRRRQILLGILAVVLAIAAYQAWPRSSAATAPSASAPLTSKQTTARAPAERGGGTTAGNPAANTQKNAGAASGAPDVHLESLSAERPKPSPAERNLFRFKPKAPPPPPPMPPGTVPGQQPMAVPTPTPTGPPPPPPITLKCIGIVDEGQGKPKIAVLTDNTGGPPLYAREGEPVAGRYRILKIGVESIEMAYLDGRGRQTIRVSGS